MSYGVPYVGSKSKIALKIIEVLPSADTFVDLFAGGCAISHAAILSMKYNRVIANDLQPYGVDLFTAAIRGEYATETRWISRGDFCALRDTDPYVRLCWSFGNNQESYLYSRELEPWKKALHYYRVLGDDSLLRAFGIKGSVEQGQLSELQMREDLRNSGISQKTLESLESLERLGRLQSLERLQSRQSLFPKAELRRSNVDYRQVKIPDGAVVYADPPYRGCHSYGVNFNYGEFDEWVRTRPFRVYVSEYDMPSDFRCVMSIWKPVTICGGGRLRREEKLYLHEKWVEEGICHR